MFAPNTRFLAHSSSAHFTDLDENEAIASTFAKRAHTNRFVESFLDDVFSAQTQRAMCV